jgi:hypothetical protein
MLEQFHITLPDSQSSEFFNIVTAFFLDLLWHMVAQGEGQTHSDGSAKINELMVVNG